MTDVDLFNWNDLRYFLAVARTGRLTLAATRLRQEHTTVSRRLASLEAALGAHLFDRSPSGYRLTEAGQRLLATAETIETAALFAHKGIRAEGGSISGDIRIGAPDGFGSYFLAPRIGKLCEQHPGIRPELIVMPRIFSLSKREADIAIGLNCPTEGRLFARKLGDYRLFLYASQSYLDQHPPITTAADLPRHSFIGYAQDFIFSPELDYLPLINSEIVPQIRSSNLVAQFNATIAGSGICVLPHFMGSLAPELRTVLADSVSLTRTFWLTSHADQHDLPQIRAMSDFIAHEVQAARPLFLPSDTPRINPD